LYPSAPFPEHRIMSADLTKLISQLDEDDPGERARAAEELCRLGDMARPAAVALVAACADPLESVREWAAAALEGLGPPDGADIEQLMVLTRHHAPSVAYWAVTLLGRSGPAADAAVGALSAALRDHAASAVRQRAAWALGKVGQSATNAIDELEAAAASDDPRLARLARQAIDQLANGKRA
jgi:HEAT repeat protein